MTKLQIFDPSMCCSSGVCGPEVDPALVQFAADLKWLGAQGIAVERYNLGQQPEAFVENRHVLQILNDAGADVLPLIVKDGAVVSHTRYPSREELARMAGVDPVREESPFTETFTELVVIGKAPASDCCGGEDCC